jgi:hypothetical protein
MHLPQSCHRGFPPFGLESKKKASLTIVCATWWFKVRKCMYWRELFEKLGGREKICLSSLPGTDIMFCLTRKIWPPCFQNFLDSIATCREWKKAWWALQKTGTMQKLYSRGPPSRPTRWCVQSQKDLPSAHHHAVTTHLLVMMVPSLFRFAPFPVDIWKGCHIVLVEWNVVLLSHGLFTENDGKVGCQNGS